jgi:hypothetical protein
MRRAILALFVTSCFALCGTSEQSFAQEPAFKQRHKFNIPNELNNSGLAEAAVFSPDANQVLVTVNSNPLQLWDAVKGTKKFSIPIKAITDDEFGFYPRVTWSPDGKSLIVYQEGMDMALYNLATKKRLKLPPQKSDHFQMRWFVADQAAFITGEFQKYQLNIVKVSPWKQTAKVALKESSVYDIDVSPDGSMIGLAFESGMGIYGVDGKEIAKLDLKDHGNCHQVAFSPDSKQLAQACGGELLVYDLSTKQNKELERSGVSFGQAMSYTADGAKIILAGGPEAAILDAATGKPLATQKLAGNGTATLAKSGLLLSYLNTEAKPAELTLTDVEVKLGASLLPAAAVAEAPPKAEAKPAPVPQAAAFRQWSSADGNFKVEASYVQANATHVQLKRKDNGQLLAIPIEKLSAEDQEYLQTLQTPEKK